MTKSSFDTPSPCLPAQPTARRPTMQTPLQPGPKVIFCVRGAISPLLANLYMRQFVLGWKMLGLEQSLGSRIVTYADDLVISCRKGKAEQALQHLRELMGKLKLTVNEEKTRICKVPEGEFNFLGLLVRADVLGENRKSLPRLPAIEEERRAHGGN